MKSMEKRYLPVAVALGGGVVGLGLRLWQVKTGFEPGTGLAIPGAPAATALMVWSALMAGVLFLLIARKKGRWSFDTAFEAQGDQVYVTAAVLSAFLLLGSAGLEVLDYAATYSAALEAEANGVMLAAALPPLRIAGNILGAVCVLFIARNNYRGLKKGKENLAVTGLCYTYCVWLISFYQRRAGDPVIQNYLYQVLAITAGLMGCYYLMDWSFQKGKLRRTCFFGLMATYFSLVTFLDASSMAERLNFGFGVLFFSSHMALLLRDHPEEPQEDKKDGDDSGDTDAGEGDAPASSEGTDGPDSTALEAKESTEPETEVNDHG